MAKHASHHFLSSALFQWVSSCSVPFGTADYSVFVDCFFLEATLRRLSGGALGRNSIGRSCTNNVSICYVIVHMINLN